jgi:hypothetical protein
MERRARRWRLPLAARIGAVPVLVALAGALAFGFNQSDAAPGPSPAAQKQTGSRPPVLFRGVDPNHLPRHQQLEVRFAIAFGCTSLVCDGPKGNVHAVLKKGGADVARYDVALTDAARQEEPGGPPVFITETKPVTIPADALADGGEYTIVHGYGGDANFTGTQDRSDNVKVDDEYRSSFLVATSPNPSHPGQEVTYTATYNGFAAPGGLKPTGNIFFLKNGVLFGAGPLANGVATWKTTKFPTGTSEIGASFFGDDNFLKSQAGGSAHTVKESIGTSTTLTVSPTRLVSGTSAHFKVTVKANTGTAVPTGTITLHLGGGSTAVAPLPANGIWEADSALVSTGETSMSATYEPTGDFAASKSADVKVTVLKASPTTTVTAKPEAVRPGEPITLSAKVNPGPGSAGTPDGKITFSDGDSKLGDCTMVAFGCEITTDKLPLGRRTVTAAYSGDIENNPSTGSTTVRVFEGSTTKLTVAPASVQAGSAVVLNAQVAGADSKITAPLGGKVTFLAGTTELGRAEVDKDGKAAFSSTGLAVGTHSVTARFDGSDALDPSTSEKVSVQVNAVDTAGQGGGSQGGGNGGSQGGQNGGTGGGNPQPKNLASTGASIAQPIGIGALLLILGAVALTVSRRRRHRRAR